MTVSASNLEAMVVCQKTMDSSHLVGSEFLAEAKEFEYASKGPVHECG